ncbi:50S ribosomal protein L19e [Candidatus Bathyarchaeota archaeon]|nr:50S ribosomal protein L19e [Candidatus Bathyarchaeota archaeon]RJS73979.1 MAG: 50S ribosomal protein L19e [Candidatus Bathyarchaeota archaeon]
MNVSVQRRMAAEILGVGVNRIWIDPSRLEDVRSAITREDIKRLIAEGVISKKPEKGTSRVRVRMRKGRRRGPGSRKGARKARLNPENLWPAKVRALRSFLRYLRDRRIISRSVYRELYLKVKGGAFQDVAALKRYIQVHNLVRRRFR